MFQITIGSAAGKKEKRAWLCYVALLLSETGWEGARAGRGAVWRDKKKGGEGRRKKIP